MKRENIHANIWTNVRENVLNNVPNNGRINLRDNVRDNVWMKYPPPMESDVHVGESGGMGSARE